MDTVSRAKRSKIMSAIKSTGTRSTELRLRGWLISKGIRGWTTNGRGLPGAPDIVFPKKKLAIFVDGCFWHGCAHCTRNLRPQSNKKYWEKKIAGNMRRDQKQNRELKKHGWEIARIWEHDVRLMPKSCQTRMLRKIQK